MLSEINITGSQSSLLTVDAMLRIKEVREAGSVFSDDGDLV